MVALPKPNEDLVKPKQVLEGQELEFKVLLPDTLEQGLAEYEAGLGDYTDGS